MDDDRPVSNLYLIWRLIRFGLGHRRLIVAALSVTVFMQIMAVGALVSTGLAVDVLRRHADPEVAGPKWPFGLAPPDQTTLLTLLLFAAGATLVCEVLRAAGYYFGRKTDELLAQAIVVDLRDQVYRKLQRLSFSFYDSNDSGTIINRVTGDVQSIRMFVQGALIRSVTSLVTLVVFGVAMLAIHVWLTLACFVFGLLQILVLLNYARFARPAFRQQRRLVDRVILKLSESIQGVRVVRAFGREPEQVEQFEERSADVRDQRYAIWKLMGTHMPVVNGLSWLSVAVLIGYGGRLVQLGPAAGGIALGSIWVFFGLLRTLSMQVEAIVRVAAQLPESLTGAERVFAILDTDPVIASPSPSVPFEHGVARGVIEFRNVTFGYDPDQPVLHDVSFTLEPGETVAMVGPTGGGKSTILQLIARFYDVQRGQVLVDGVDVRERDLAQLRRSIGFVFQEAYLFSNDVAANIGFGEVDAARDRIEHAARIASAEDFITQLEQGYDTIVGERGVMLSGGERQRISIARAMLIDPPILLLDDATSAVDAETERAIQEGLDHTARERTVLIVAHRLSTLRRADRVIVIERGRIVAEGTHDELMATDGHYRESALVQLERDEEEEIVRR